jgi:hypothetical protein
MKRYIKYSLIVVVSLIGCEDYLNKPIQGSQVLDNYFATPIECERALMGCYESLSPDDWWQLDYFWLVGDVCSDEAFKGNSIEGDQRDFGNLANYNIHANNEWLEYKWLYSYVTISRCNLLIENVTDGPLTKAEENLYIAETKFLRALAYFELVKNFGGVPLLLEPTNLGEDYLPKNSVEEVYTAMENDLKDAAVYLPLKSEQEEDVAGRATKGAAHALMAKIHLYQEEWNMAVQYADSVIASGEYNLITSFQDIWKVNSPNGQGSIFEIQHSYHDIHYIGTALPVITRSRNDGGWGFASPSSYLENALQGDPRLQWTIIKEGDNVDAEHASYDTKLSENESGRINRKYYLPFDDRPPKDETYRTGLNHILIRYADLLLIHAEASYQNGNEAAAQSSLEKVRARVGLSRIGLTGPALLNAIYTERQLELALEGHRYYDLKRTGRLTTVIQDFVDYNLNRSTDPYDAGNSSGVLFLPGIHELFPIPEREINLSKGTLIQNNGY